MVTESDYPYTSGDGGKSRCKSGDLASPVINLKGFKTIDRSNTDARGVESAMAKYASSHVPCQTYYT